MKLPRDLQGWELVKALQVLGYGVTRQSGSHIRVTTEQNGEHHVTVPDHSPLRVGTLSAIITEVAKHFEMERDPLITRLFGK